MKVDEFIRTSNILFIRNRNIESEDCKVLLTVNGDIIAVRTEFHKN